MAIPHHAVDPVQALERRVAAHGAQPLLTCYDTADGSRVEFSARTFANWVDKTGGLLGSLGLDEGSDVGLPLLLDHPGHWVSLVWTMACWQVGCRVLALPRDDLDRVDLAVVGPTHAHPVPGVETVVCSLHPLGAGLGHPAPGVTDYATVLGEPDLHWRTDLPDPLLDEGTSRRLVSDLAGVQPLTTRRLVQPSGNPWTDLGDLLLAPLSGGGSVVAVRGDASDDLLTRISDEEHASRI